MPFRVGIIIGCEDDAVEDRKYVGSLDFLQDLPDEYRVDPKSSEYLNRCKKGTKGVAHSDVAIAWYLQKHNDDMVVDLIPPEEISLKRLKSNDCNYVMGYDVVNAALESITKQKQMEHIFRNCGNLMPPFPFQEHIYFKSRYLQACQDAGVPIAPTLFVGSDRNVPHVIDRITARGWKTFVIKQSFSACAIGFLKVTTDEVCRKPKILEQYFQQYASTREFVLQEAIPGFRTNWETRVFWWKGQFLYAVANKAAVASPTGKEVIVTGDEIPQQFLKEAKRVGKMALKTLPQLTTPQGKPIDMMTLIRTDIGCSDTKLDDKDCTWKAGKPTFFLNELEFGSINLFIRHLKFDAVPLWAQKLAEGCREVSALDGHNGSRSRKRSASNLITGAESNKKGKRGGA